MSLEVDSVAKSIEIIENHRFHRNQTICDKIGGNPICCGGKTCCKTLCCGARRCGIPVRAHPRLGNIFLHFVCITIAFVFAFARVDYGASFNDYLVSINTPYVDPVELAFMKQFGIEAKSPSRRLLFINRFLKASGGGGSSGGSGGSSGGEGGSDDANTDGTGTVA